MDGCNINKSSRQTRNSACVALYARVNLYSRKEASAEVERNSVERVRACRQVAESTHLPNTSKADKTEYPGT